MRKYKQLTDSYRFSGYEPKKEITGRFGDPKAIIICLNRIKKKQSVHYAQKLIGVITTEKSDTYVIFLAAINEYISQLKYGVLIVMIAKK